jgi:putative flippase GtrA
MNVHLHRIPRYTLVAILCALLHNGILIGMDAIGANVFWCQFASASVLTPVGYLAMSTLTFRCERSWRGFGRYAAALLTNFPVALSVLWLSRDLFSMPMWAAAPISSIAMFCWNYLMSSWALSQPERSVEATVRG